MQGVKSMNQFYGDGEETVIFTAPQVESDNAHLRILDADGQMKVLHLNRSMTIGREKNNSTADFTFASKYVSGNHGRFTKTGKGFFYEDTNTSNGTYINDQFYRKDQLPQKLLTSGDVIRIGSKDDKIMAERNLRPIIMIYGQEDIMGEVWQALALMPDGGEICIGRGNGTVASLNDKRISRKHASLFCHEGRWAVTDHDSKNGVFVNNVRIKEPIYLSYGDCVRVIDHYFIFLGDQILFNTKPMIANVPITGSAPQYDETVTVEPERKPQMAAQSAQSPAAKMPSPMGTPMPGVMPNPMAAPNQVGTPNPYMMQNMMADHQPTAGMTENPADVLYQQGQDFKVGPQLSIFIEERSAMQRFKKLTLLKDVHMTINPGEFVLILGGSGAGKTTFMNAVMGYEKAQKATIRHGNRNIYEDYNAVKYDIGFVPQTNLLRMSDTVEQTLLNAAKMKMPANTKKKDMEQRVTEVLETLDLTPQRHAKVSVLSGGQVKRVSVAVELIANPSLFFLDEPDSGLDAGSAGDLMENLRAIADQGKIVMIITHSPDRAADKFDKVVVLGKSKAQQTGRLAFYGSPAEAYEFFGIKSLEGVVRLINKEPDKYIQKYEELERSRGNRM